MCRAALAVFDLVVPRADQPQDCVDHEEGKHADEKQVHEQAHKVEAGIELAIMRVGVGLVLNKADIGAGVAAAAGLHQVGPVDRRPRIAGGKDFMRPVTVPAARRLHVSAEKA